MLLVENSTANALNAHWLCSRGQSPDFSTLRDDIDYLTVKVVPGKVNCCPLMVKGVTLAV